MTLTSIDRARLEGKPRGKLKATATAKVKDSKRRKKATDG